MRHGTRVRVVRLTTERGNTFDSVRDLKDRKTVCIVDGIQEVNAETDFVFAFLKVPGGDDNNRPCVPMELLEPV